jgi:hypothetical protein
MCYEMLTWEQPFEGEKMGDLFKRITANRLRPELPDECPSRLTSLIQKGVGNTILSKGRTRPKSAENSDTSKVFSSQVEHALS